MLTDFSFKQYLIFDDIFENSLKKVFLEITIENTTRFICESLSETPNTEEATRLKNAILWIRWDSTLKRQKEVKQAKLLFEKFKKTKEIDWSQAIPLLEKMGYINPQKTRKYNSSKLLEALTTASNETNELPQDVTEKEVEKNINNAKKTFFEVLKSVFENEYKSIVSRRTNSSYTKDRKTGFRLFDGEDDLINSFSIKMIDFISKKSPLLNTNFSKIGKAELASDEFTNRIIAFLRSALYRQTGREYRARRLANSPALRKEDVIKNRSRKKSMLKLDLSKGEDGLAFYKKYLRAIVNNVEEKFKISNDKDRNRAEILLHIKNLQSRYSHLFSLLPENLNKTLSNYYIHFLSSNKPNPLLFMGSLDSVDGDVPRGLDWQKGYPEEELVKSKFDREGLVLGKAYQDNQFDKNEFLLKKLHQAMNLLMKKNPKSALALCVKFGLNCSANSVNSVSDFSNAIIQMTADGKIKQAKKLDCVSQCGAIGLTIYQTAEGLSKLIGSPQKPETVRVWIAFGLKFICDELSKSIGELE